jgi:UDP-N-acetylmuramyl tripeptide synthase
VAGDTVAAGLAAEAPEANHGFENSRRLLGANRYFGAPAVTLSPLGAAAANPAVHAAWERLVRERCAALAWPDPEPRSVAGASGTLLVFRAPVDLLFTATEINEWAWERAARAAGETSFDLAQDVADPAAHFAARAGAERVPALVALREAAAAHGLTLLEDESLVTVGTGVGGRSWAREAPPAPDAVPWQELRDVPTALVTGSNGKTTTVRLLAAIATAAGLRPGFCCTEGVFVGGTAVESGDYSGPDGARRVLRAADVEAAILETARGGILRRGLAAARADVAVVTNISPDHLGEYGVDGAADLAETKLVVAHALPPRGTLVLNADDATLAAVAPRLAHVRVARQALFALDYDHPRLADLRARGGATCGVRAGALWLSSDGVEHPLGALGALPLAVAGAAPYNVLNLAAAALAATALGLPLGATRRTLGAFGARADDNPGRLERWSHAGATVIIDYAHNPDGLHAVLEVARALAPRRLALLLGQAGNRDDAAIADLARTAARFAPDRIVIKELPLMLRGRAAGEVPALLERVLVEAGVPAASVAFEADEARAALDLIDTAQPGDVIVLPIHTKAVREMLRERLRPAAPRPS